MRLLAATLALGLSFSAESYAAGHGTEASEKASEVMVFGEKLLDVSEDRWAFKYKNKLFICFIHHRTQFFECFENPPKSN